MEMPSNQKNPEIANAFKKGLDQKAFFYDPL